MDHQIKDSTMEASSVEGLKMDTMDLNRALDLTSVENGGGNSVENLVQVTTGVSAHALQFHCRIDICSGLKTLPRISGNQQWHRLSGNRRLYCELRDASK